MPQSLQFVAPDSVLTGWDFSTGGVKCLAFDLDGNTLDQVRLTTDLHRQGKAVELNLMQLEGQARASTRAIAARLRTLGRLANWVAGGISATHHTAGRLDRDRGQVRRAICWNDQSLTPYHARGLERLGGQKKVRQLIGGPWAVRYSLSHLVKDEATLDRDAWRRTDKIVQHGALAAGYLTGNFDVVSVSAAASTGLMDLRSGEWARPMLDALADAELRELAWTRLPRVVDQFEPVGPLSANLAMEAGLDLQSRPLIFPTSDDQQAGLVGGGAVDAGQLAVVLGNSAVVNSSSDKLPTTDALDVMRLNWGPYLWMRCYTNGAQFLDHVLGKKPDWPRLEAAARALPPGAGGTMVLPFLYSEPSIGVPDKLFRWLPSAPRDAGTRYRASLEALAYLIALGVRQHEKAGQKITRITVSGGIARSELMCQVLASVLGRRLERLRSDEGPALGAAVTALAALEAHLRHKHGHPTPYTVADAVAQMVRFREPVDPNPAWQKAYARELRRFEQAIKGKR